jgi:predicted transcriptional regulator
MLAKKEVIKSLKEMSEHFSVDDAIDRLIVLNKIENARTEIAEGKGLTTEQARKKLHKWLK